MRKVNEITLDDMFLQFFNFLETNTVYQSIGFTQFFLNLRKKSILLVI